MALGPGTRLGVYEIIGLLGSGGMGEVWRARDGKLQRDVAIKVLPQGLCDDPERLARFEREAQTLAALSHPNIAHVHGFDDSTGAPALVMELVEGPTLADRLARGPIPVDEALPIAKQVAEGLAAAHEQGIIHRDLKPANIKLRDDGAVKILDFGLAKALEPRQPSGINATQSPTITTPAMMTGVGVILGTAAYMSPEQAKGRPADKRSDVWAFGCVLYEMLTAKRAFEGEDASETLAAVLRAQPDWSAFPATVPAALVQLIRACLAKSRAERIPEISAALFLLNYTPDDQSSTPSHRRRAWWMAAALLAACGLTATVSLWALSNPLTPPRLARLTIPLDGPALSIGSPFPDVVISPDGQWIVYSVGGAATGGQNELMIRRIDQLEASPLRGPSGPTSTPFFSPDSRWVGYATPSELWKVPVNGGAALRICGLDSGLRGASWGANDTIVLGTNDATGLRLVSASGGELKQLTTLDANQGEIRHVLPTVLPGGQVALFTVQLRRGGGFAPAARASLIAAVDLQTGRRHVVVPDGSQAQYVDPGYLVYATNGSIMAVRFDPKRVETAGEPVRFAQGVLTKPTLASDFAVSRDGTLVYVAGNVTATGAQSVAQAVRSLTWVDRAGDEEAIPAPPRPYVYARLSPDGTRIALDIRDQDADIWIWDVTRGTLSRLTSDPALETSPVWTPDGRRVVFGSQRAGTSNLYWQAADGTGTAERLTTSAFNQVPTSMSPDGRQVVFYSTGSNLDLMTLRLDAPRRTEPLLSTEFAESNADISPDGRWVAYQSNESGQMEVYVRPFPMADRGRFPISTAGGHHPRWGHSGRELFYFNDRNELISVPVATGETFKPGAPTKVLDAKYYAGGPGAGARTYDVSPDDRRFLMIKGPATERATDVPKYMIVILNWREELKTRLGTG